MRTGPLAAAALALSAALAACGSASAAHPAAHATPAPTTALQACRALRADILANGGQPDAVTLHRLVARLPVGGTPGLRGTLAADLAVWNDVGTSLWPLDAAHLARDCRPTGVQIPGG